MSNMLPNEGKEIEAASKLEKLEGKKKHSLPSSEKIPVDIVIDILKRLPIMSLMKFMSLSKQWKSIIQSSPFVTDYNRSIQPPNNIFVGYESEKYVDIFNADDDLDYLQRHTICKQAHLWGLNFDSLIDYSQGLFAFACDKPKDVVIWNLSIGKSVRIPLHKWRWDN
uniref:putative F-box protein At5g44220 n=1 Tax=Erigeron canadensis TaxID=72917 RepID=UPI001CB8D17E|nr:putative F-box protein At5g44220 [Erigeron canadensis]